MIICWKQDLPSENRGVLVWSGPSRKHPGPGILGGQNGDRKEPLVVDQKQRAAPSSGSLSLSWSPLDLDLTACVHYQTEENRSSRSGGTVASSQTTELRWRPRWCVKAVPIRVSETKTWFCFCLVDFACWEPHTNTTEKYCVLLGRQVKEGRLVIGIHTKNTKLYPTLKISLVC